MSRYEVIQATSPEEAKSNSKFTEGGYASIVQLEAVANSDGTYSVFPIIEPISNLLERHCLDCHNRYTLEANLNQCDVCGACNYVTVLQE